VNHRVGGLLRKWGGYFWEGIGFPGSAAPTWPLILSRRAISELLIPARLGQRPDSAPRAAGSRPAQSFPRPPAPEPDPALVLSRRISLSNSAKMASRPALARPAGVVKV